MLRRSFRYVLRLLLGWVCGSRGRHALFPPKGEEKKAKGQRERHAATQLKHRARGCHSGTGENRRRARRPCRSCDRRQRLRALIEGERPRDDAAGSCRRRAARAVAQSTARAYSRSFHRLSMFSPITRLRCGHLLEQVEARHAQHRRAAPRAGSPLARDDRGSAERDQTPARTQQVVAAPEALAADRVHDQVELRQAALPAGRGVVERVIDAELGDPRVLAGRGRAVDLGASALAICVAAMPTPPPAE